MFISHNNAHKGSDSQSIKSGRLFMPILYLCSHEDSVPQDYLLGFAYKKDIDDIRELSLVRA